MKHTEFFLTAEKKQNYDNFGHAAFEGGGGRQSGGRQSGGFGGADFSDIFRGFFW